MLKNDLLLRAARAEKVERAERARRHKEQDYEVLLRKYEDLQERWNTWQAIAT